MNMRQQNGCLGVCSVLPLRQSSITVARGSAGMETLTGRSSNPLIGLMCNSHQRRERHPGSVATLVSAGGGTTGTDRDNEESGAPARVAVALRTLTPAAIPPSKVFVGRRWTENEQYHSLTVQPRPAPAVSAAVSRLAGGARRASGVPVAVSALKFRRQSRPASRCRAGHHIYIQMFLWLSFYIPAGRGGERGDAGCCLVEWWTEEVLARIRVAHLADPAPRDTLHALSSVATLTTHRDALPATLARLYDCLQGCIPAAATATTPEVRRCRAFLKDDLEVSLQAATRLHRGHAIDREALPSILGSEVSVPPHSAAAPPIPGPPWRVSATPRHHLTTPRFPVTQGPFSFYAICLGSLPAAWVGEGRQGRHPRLLILAANEVGGSALCLLAIRVFTIFFPSLVSSASSHFLTFLCE
ncbi:hypothetical protein O3P69_002805 [Scylla paramamosain]|uniref:Uncharacterized protein n=1 Tax=Scylla paramamosain TaxID=85552 RepID=A0AAW0UMF4_SCYPA